MNEIDFVKKNILKDDFFGFKKAYIESGVESVSFLDTIDELLDYCFYSEFNPYLDKCYLDYAYLRNSKTGLIYNIDDMFDVYVDNLEDIKQEENKRV